MRARLSAFEPSPGREPETPHLLFCLALKDLIMRYLADEYLRLSYHGMRAKENSFNVTMNTSFDKSIGKTNIVPQDIGRVLLNLFNNAFYSVNEKKKTLQPPTVGGGIQYEPAVFVSTKKIDGIVEIKVRDNGKGISPKVLDKIYQPFLQPSQRVKEQDWDCL